jgi:hypothetical protein
MSEAPRMEPPAEPEWVQRMRAAGYNIRVGSGEPMSEIPDAYFYPPPTLRNRTRESLVRGYRRLVRALTSTRGTTHAPLP